MAEVDISYIHTIYTYKLGVYGCNIEIAGFEYMHILYGTYD